MNPEDERLAQEYMAWQDAQRQVSVVVEEDESDDADRYEGPTLGRYGNY